MADRLAAISVDLDEIPCYSQIHGLEPPNEASSHAVYLKAIPRFERLFDELNIKATFFAIGRDLADNENAAIIQRLNEKGHEIANHSANHLYDLTRRDRATIRDEIRQGAIAINDVTGKHPVGFRAPGYTITDEVLNEIVESGAQYDSSVFPCPLYYTAKAAAIAAIRISGRRSHSVSDTPLMLASPSEPYRIGVPYWRRGQGLLEFPIGVTSGLTGRIPFIGTTLILAGANGSRFLTRHMLRQPFVNLELHGIELADAKEDNLEFLKKHQPDMRRSRLDKEAALRSAIAELERANYRFVTLAQAADRFAVAASK
jgi:peptidoglycan-N-acetylglucosamine deacetylase